MFLFVSLACACPPGCASLLFAAGRDYDAGHAALDLVSVVLPSSPLYCGSLPYRRYGVPFAGSSFLMHLLPHLVALRLVGVHSMHLCFGSSC